MHQFADGVVYAQNTETFNNNNVTWVNLGRMADFTLNWDVVDIGEPDNPNDKIRQEALRKTIRAEGKGLSWSVPITVSGNYTTSAPFIVTTNAAGTSWEVDDTSWTYAS